MTRELYRLSLFIIAAFGGVALATAYWTTIQRESLLAREDNPRQVLAALNIQRGRIYDRHETLLAYTEPATLRSQGATRIYPHPEAVSPIGHYSYQFGLAGLEEGFDALLRAQGYRSTFTRLSDDLLNRDVVGGDVQSTIDLAQQSRLHAAMTGHIGAALVVQVPSGEVLAMVSLPAYDPNSAEMLRQMVGGSTTQPNSIRLLNRVTQGRYQPGGALQTLLLNNLLAAGVAPNTQVNLESMQLDQPALSLGCVLEPTPAQWRSPTLADAYLLGCPTPFVNSMGTRISPEAFRATLTAAGFGQAPYLGGFLPLDSPSLSLHENLNAEAAGQGGLTVTPLHMAQVIAAVVHDGNGVPLHLARATRYPANADWQPFRPSAPLLAVMQSSTAASIKSLLQTRSFDPEMPLYGHLSHAIAGERVYVWFLGWTPLEDGGDKVLVIVLEGQDLHAEAVLGVARAALR